MNLDPLLWSIEGRDEGRGCSFMNLESFCKNSKVLWLSVCCCNLWNFLILFFWKMPRGCHSVVTICKFFNIKLEVFVSFIHSAICPYLALETCRQWHLTSRTIALMRTGTMPTMTVESKPSRISRRWCHKYFVALRLVDLGTSYRVCHWGCLLALCQNTCSEVLVHSPTWVLWYVHICPEICLSPEIYQAFHHCTWFRFKSHDCLVLLCLIGNSQKHHWWCWRTLCF